MKKRKFGYKLSRGKGARIALFRGLIKSLVEHGSIEVTFTKAQAVKPEIEKLVKLAKGGTVTSARRVYSRLGNDRATADKLVKEVAVVFKDVQGGYVRIIDLGRRKGDQARLARLEWSKEVPVVAVEKKEEPKKKITKAKDNKKSVAKKTDTKKK